MLQLHRVYSYDNLFVRLSSRGELVSLLTTKATNSQDILPPPDKATGNGIRKVDLRMSKHESMNYFKVLDLSPDKIQGKDESAIADLVNESHARLYKKALASRYTTRSDGMSIEDWMDILNKARDTLKNPQKRQAYLTSLGLVEEKGRLVEPKLGHLPEASNLRIDSVGTVTKPDVQPSKDNRGVGGKQPRQPVSEEAENGNNAPVAQNSDYRDANFDKVNKGDARLPGWVRVLGCLWWVTIPGLILLNIYFATRNSAVYKDIWLFAIITLIAAIVGFCFWVGATLSIKGVPFRTKVGAVFKVIVAMLAAFSFFVLSVLLLVELGLIEPR